MGIHQVPATHLNINDRLWDGAVIINTSHQLNWFYVQAVKPGSGYIVRRRYRHDALVTLKEDEAE